MSTVASTNHLPRAERMSRLLKRAVTDGILVVLFAVIIFIFPGQVFTFVPAVLACYFVCRMGSAMYMLQVERAGAALAEAEDNFNARNPDQPIGPGAAVEQAANKIAAGTLETFRDNNIHPASIVVALFNLAGSRSNSCSAFVSRMNADGSLTTSRFPDAAAQRLFASFPTPFQTGRDWRAAIISARGDGRATCQLWNEEQVDAFVSSATSMDNPEAFRAYHR